MSHDLSIILNQQQYSAPAIVSKQGAVQAAFSFYQKIMNGETSAVSIVEAFKYVEDTYKALKECTDEAGKNSLASLVRDEITRNSNDGKSYSSKNGTEFSLFEAGTKYDYTSCKDSEWADLQRQLEDVKDRIKDRETFLKSIKKPLDVLDKESGEVTQIFPPIKTSTSTYKAELQK